MRYAEVSVNSPVAQRRTFSYVIPPDLTISVGQGVLVPFGDKVLQGIVLELCHCSSVEETKEIDSVIDPRPLLSQNHILLARWISDYYLSPLWDAVALMLPPAFERNAVTLISSSTILNDSDFSSLNREQRYVIELIERHKKISLRQLERKLGKKKDSYTEFNIVKDR